MLISLVTIVTQVKMVTWDWFLMWSFTLQIMPPKGKKGKTETKTKEKTEEILRPSEKELILHAE